MGAAGTALGESAKLAAVSLVNVRLFMIDSA